MIKQSLLTIVLLSSSCVFAGKNTANALYYLTKVGCYGGATAAAVVTAPVAAPVVTTCFGAFGLGAAVGTATTVALPVATASSITAASVGGAAVQGAAFGVIAKTESLAQKAYNFGMKL